MPKPDKRLIKTKQETGYFGFRNRPSAFFYLFILIFWKITLSNDGPHHFTCYSIQSWHYSNTCTFHSNSSCVKQTPVMCFELISAQVLTDWMLISLRGGDIHSSDGWLAVWSPSECSHALDWLHTPQSKWHINGIEVDSDNVIPGR